MQYRSLSIKRTFLLLSAVFLCAQLPAQSARSLTWGKKNILRSWGFSPIIYSAGGGPKIARTDIIGTEIKQSYQQVQYINFLSFTYHVRANLINFRDKASLGLNLPFTAGIGQMYVYRSLNGGSSESITFHSEIPLLLTYNKGFHSTYNNIDNRGFYLGVGGQLVIPSILRNKNIVSGHLPSTWLQPTFAFGYKSVRMKGRRGYELLVSPLNGWAFMLVGVHTIKY